MIIIDILNSSEEEIEKTKLKSDKKKIEIDHLKNLQLQLIRLDGKLEDSY